MSRLYDTEEALNLIEADSDGELAEPNVCVLEAMKSLTLTIKNCLVSTRGIIKL